MTRKFQVLGLLTVLLLASQPQAFGWGGLGHDAVSVVAEKVVTARTQQKIRQILGNDSLVDVSSWADSVRRLDEWKHTAWYHFTKTPDHLSYVANMRNMSSGDRAKGDAVLALAKAELILKSRRKDSAAIGAQRAALAFLIHFMGDIHQPYHSGRGEDRGGNYIDVNWMGEGTNLHAVWDVKLIHSSYEDIVGMPTEAAAREYIQTIDRSTPAQRRAWMAGYFDSWIDESVQSRIRPYSGYDRNQELYRQTYIDVVNLRVLQAGYRLGALLNSYFDSNAADVIANHAASARAFHESARAALGGNYLDRIALMPLSKASKDQAEILRQITEFPPDCPHDHRDNFHE